MVIQPRIRNNMCVNAHPFGCRAQVQAQISYAQAKGKIDGPRRVLVIGASNDTFAGATGGAVYLLDAPGAL